jgi:hypothetical protein
MSAGSDKPWFGTLTEFGKWLAARTHGNKQWVEWNGRIYKLSDVVIGRMPEHAPGLVEDL